MTTALDLALPLAGSVDCRAAARLAEQAGFAGGWVSEVAHDPFLALGLAATATERLALGSAVAIAFARNPMSVAIQADDLRALGGGRFRLGLGSQVKAHVARRFSMPWDRPVERMREFVLALRAIWAAWDEGAPLAFDGEFSSHTLMPPAFVPTRHGFGPPPVLLAGVGPRMTAMAGEVADGFITHAACGPAYLREVTLPALRRGRGGDLGGFELVVTQMIASGRDGAELKTATERVRAEIAFYGSTPAYREVLAAAGRGEVADTLHALSREGRWREMAALVDDYLLHETAVVAPPAEIAAAARARHPEADRVSLYAPGGLGAELLREIGAAAAGAELDLGHELNHERKEE